MAPRVCFLSCHDSANLDTNELSVSQKISQTLASLEDHSEDVEPLLNDLNMLCNDNRASLVATCHMGGMRVLMSVLGKHIENETVVMLALSLATKLVDTIQEALDEMNIPVIINAMVHNPNRVPIQTNGLHLILAWSEFKRRDSVLDMLQSAPHFLGTIVAAMVIHFDNESIQLAGCQILETLSGCADLSEDLSRLGGLIVVKDALVAFPSNERIQQSCSNVIQRIAAKDGMSLSIKSPKLRSTLSDAIDLLPLSQ